MRSKLHHSEASTLLQKTRLFFRKYTKGLFRFAVVCIFTIIILNSFVPNLLEYLSDWANLPRPSIGSLIEIAVLFFLVERQIVIEEFLTNPPFKIYPRKEKDEYAELLESSSIDQNEEIDIIQFSGFNSLDLIKKIIKNHSVCKVRILLYDPDRANRYDADWTESKSRGLDSHAGRIFSSVREIKLAQERNSGVDIEIRYYQTSPCISLVRIGASSICLSWYRSFRDPKNNDIIRLRGHDSPAISFTHNPPSELIDFAKDHFNKVWNTAKLVP